MIVELSQIDKYLETCCHMLDDVVFLWGETLFMTLQYVGRLSSSQKSLVTCELFQEVHPQVKVDVTMLQLTSFCCRARCETVARADAPLPWERAGVVHESWSWGAAHRLPR
jgi:hypothetical protein